MSAAASPATSTTSERPSRMRVAQLLPAAHVGDATGDAALTLHRALREAGHDSRLFALEIDPPLRQRVRPVSELPSGEPGRLTLLHFALPSPLSRILADCDGLRAIVYHNLTPPELLLPHCPDVARLTAAGRRELRELAEGGRVDLAIGVSAFNTRDLEECGFEHTLHLPLPVDLDRFRVPGNRVLRRLLKQGGAVGSGSGSGRRRSRRASGGSGSGPGGTGDHRSSGHGSDPGGTGESGSGRAPVRDRGGAGGGPLFLTVGRVAPNKRLETFFKAAAYYLRYVSPKGRFHAVGTTRGLEAYADSLMELHAELELDRRVRLVGRVPHEDLVAYYRAADVYVSTSEHEGFCVPLLEAMSRDVPVVALRAAAVPETLGGAGILLDTDDPATWGEILHRVAVGPSLRRRLVASGRARLDELDAASLPGRWVDALEAWARETGACPDGRDDGAPTEGHGGSTGDEDGSAGEPGEAA